MSGRLNGACSVEPLVSLPSSDSLFPPSMNNEGRDGSVSGASHSPVSPMPDLWVDSTLLTKP